MQMLHDFFFAFAIGVICAVILVYFVFQIFSELPTFFIS